MPHYIPTSSNELQDKMYQILSIIMWINNVLYCFMKFIAVLRYILSNKCICIVLLHFLTVYSSLSFLLLFLNVSYYLVPYTSVTHAMFSHF